MLAQENKYFSFLWIPVLASSAEWVGEENVEIQICIPDKKTRASATYITIMFRKPNI